MDNNRIVKGRCKDGAKFFIIDYRTTEEKRLAMELKKN